MDLTGISGPQEPVSLQLFRLGELEFETIMGN